MSLALRADPAPGERAIADALAACLIFGSVILLFFVSPMALGVWGFSYGSAGGSFLEKIHPASWLAFAAIVPLALAGSPGTLYFNAVTRRNPGIVVYCIGFAVLFQHVVLVQRMAFTPLIDTFLAPAALFLGIAHFTAGEKRGLALILHVALLANALLGLYEFATGWRLTPFTPSADGVEFEIDWRSSAFLGHPLANAMTTGVYALILAQGGGRDLPAVLRPAALAVQLVAMVAFGGRASLVVLALLLLVVALRGGFRLARGRELDLAQAGLALLALPVLAIVLDQAIASGFFDRLVERFVDDKGSAKSRLVLMHIVGQFSLGDLLIGPDPGKLTTLQGVEGVEFGIESFWIGMILAYGVIASCFLFAGLAFFCREVMRETRRGSGLVLVFFIAVASTSVSLSAKSLMLAQMTVLSLVLLARDGSARAGPLPERGDA